MDKTDNQENMNLVNVSILVPIYNVEEYLARCIDSVLMQDFKNWEMILVDDGSLDDSPKICDEYAINDKRIKVSQKESGGLVSARLAGFEAAVGKYLLFLDSDDYLLPNALSVLYNKIEEGYDMVRGAYMFVYPDGTAMPSISQQSCAYNGEDSYRQMLIYGKIENYMWGAIYRHEVIEKRFFNSCNNISIGEDWCLSFLTANNIRKLYVIKDVVYAYWMNSYSMMHQKIASHQYIEKMHNVVVPYIAECSDGIHKSLEAHRIAAHTNLSFHHEIRYDDVYRKMLLGFIESNGKDAIVPMLGKSYFLAFIKYPHVYRMFNYVVKILIKYKKYKGQTRKVID